MPVQHTCNCLFSGERSPKYDELLSGDVCLYSTRVSACFQENVPKVPQVAAGSDADL